MNTQTQKLTVFILFLAALSVVIYYLVFNKKDKPKTYVLDTINSGASANTSTTSNSNASTALFPLKKGQMNSKYVKALQKGMNNKFFTNLDTDGDFGNNTQKAVEKHLDPIYKLKPSVIGVAWGVFKEQGFDKLV